MTDTNKDLLRAIRDQPDDDILRLAYADYLDGLDTVSVPCPKCGGRGSRKATDDVHGRNRTQCEPCSGTGFVPDTSNRDRAELIRVQVELARTPDPKRCPECKVGGLMPQKFSSHPHLSRCQNCEYQRGPFWAEIEHRADRYGFLLRRERALLDTNADRWRKGPACNNCEGKGTLLGSAGDKHNPDCRHCFGTGDAGGLMRRDGRDEPHPTKPDPFLHKVEYVRGMKRVHCRAEDVWHLYGQHCKECGNIYSTIDCPTCQRIKRHVEWQPTPWALAVCRHHPDVVSFWIEDRDPFAGGPSSFSDGHHGWNTDRHSSAVDSVFKRSEVPDPIHEMLPPCELGETGPALWRWYKTPDAARTALANTVFRWVHSFLK